MYFHKNNNTVQIGDRVVTTIKHESFAGYFEVGSIVTVTAITAGGYDIKDDEGNIIRKIGWVI